jgi:hypothetical protein
LSRAVRQAELIAGLLLLYFALAVNPAQHMLLFLAFVLEALVAFYVSLRFESHGHARTVAILLSLAVVLPILIRALTGAYTSGATATPAVIRSFVLVAVLATCQLVALFGAVLYRRPAAPSA